MVGLSHSGGHSDFPGTAAVISQGAQSCTRGKQSAQGASKTALGHEDSPWEVGENHLGRTGGAQEGSGGQILRHLEYSRAWSHFITCQVSVLDCKPAQPPVLADGSVTSVIPGDADEKQRFHLPQGWSGDSGPLTACVW